MNFIKKLVPLFAVCLLVISLAGCVALAVGAAAGVGGYAWVSGALTKEYQVSAEQLYRAALRGVKSLKIIIQEEKADRLTGKISGKFADGKKVAVDISAMTERSAKLTIRVDIFGDKAKSEMILNAIEKNL